MLVAIKRQFHKVFDETSIASTEADPPAIEEFKATVMNKVRELEGSREFVPYALAINELYEFLLRADGASKSKSLSVVEAIRRQLLSEIKQMADHYARLNRWWCSGTVADELRFEKFTLGTAPSWTPTTTDLKFEDVVKETAKKAEPLAEHMEQLVVDRQRLLQHIIPLPSRRTTVVAVGASAAAAAAGSSPARDSSIDMSDESKVAAVWLEFKASALDKGIAKNLIPFLPMFLCQTDRNLFIDAQTTLLSELKELLPAVDFVKDSVRGDPLDVRLAVADKGRQVDICYRAAYIKADDVMNETRYPVMQINSRLSLALNEDRHLLATMYLQVTPYDPTLKRALRVLRLKVPKEALRIAFLTDPAKISAATTAAVVARLNSTGGESGAAKRVRMAFSRDHRAASAQANKSALVYRQPGLPMGDSLMDSSVAEEDSLILEEGDSVDEGAAAGADMSREDGYSGFDESLVRPLLGSSKEQGAAAGELLLRGGSAPLFGGLSPIRPGKSREVGADMTGIEAVAAAVDGVLVKKTQEKLEDEAIDGSQICCCFM